MPMRKAKPKSHIFYKIRKMLKDYIDFDQWKQSLLLQKTYMSDHATPLFKITSRCPLLF